MNLAKQCVASVTVICIGGLSACTTVDLSQVAIDKPQAVSVTPKQNVVEKAALSLTSKFKSKGWCKNDPAEKTQTATNVLLNGMQALDEKNTAIPATVISARQLSADLSEANNQVQQTTKAAEVFLVMSEDMDKLDTELSQLEAALLSAREAEANFGKTLQTSSNLIVRRKYFAFSHSVDALKNVTDAYGKRIRSQIAARASAGRS